MGSANPASGRVHGSLGMIDESFGSHGKGWTIRNAVAVQKQNRIHMNNVYACMKNPSMSTSATQSWRYPCVWPQIQFWPGWRHSSFGVHNVYQRNYRKRKRRFCVSQMIVHDSFNRKTTIITKHTTLVSKGLIRDLGRSLQVKET